MAQGRKPRRETARPRPPKPKRNPATPRSSRSTASGASKRPVDPVLARSLALLAPLGPVAARALFGGYGLYLDGTIFAIIAWERLYFRTDARTKQAFRSAGGEPFLYEGRGRVVEMPYSTAPPEATTTKRLLPWAERAVAAARRVAQAKRRKVR